MTYSDRLNDSPFLTTDEVLGYLKVNARTIYRLIKAGQLPAIRVGRQWRVRRCDLDAWLDRQRNSAHDTPPTERPRLRGEPLG